MIKVIYSGYQIPNKMYIFGSANLSNQQIENIIKIKITKIKQIHQCFIWIKSVNKLKYLLHSYTKCGIE